MPGRRLLFCLDLLLWISLPFRVLENADGLCPRTQARKEKRRAANRATPISPRGRLDTGGWIIFPGLSERAGRSRPVAASKPVALEKPRVLSERVTALPSKRSLARTSLVPMAIPQLLAAPRRRRAVLVSGVRAQRPFIRSSPARRNTSRASRMSPRNADQLRPDRMPPRSRMSWRREPTWTKMPWRETPGGAAPRRQGARSPRLEVATVF